MKGKKTYTNNGKIYKIVSDYDERYYIDKTTTPLNVRIAYLRRRAKDGVDKPLFNFINEIGKDNIRIVLIRDEFECKNINHLTREYQQCLDDRRGDTNCLNFLKRA